MFQDEGEITTTGTQMGDEFEQLQEILREKDQMIDMLTKEKNYYYKKTEMIQKQMSQQSLNTSKIEENS